MGKGGHSNTTVNKTDNTYRNTDTTNDYHKTNVEITNEQIDVYNQVKGDKVHGGEVALDGNANSGNTRYYNLQNLQQQYTIEQAQAVSPTLNSAWLQNYQNNIRNNNGQDLVAIAGFDFNKYSTFLVL